MNATEGKSILRPPCFDGTNYIHWKEHMKVFIQSADFKLWLVIKNGPKIPKKKINGREIEKCEEEFDEADMKNMELEAKAKNILYCAIDPDAFQILSECQTAKQMWDKLHMEFNGEIDNSTPQEQPVTAEEPYDPYRPNIDFMQDTREAMDAFLEYCVPLHKHALMGNWTEAKLILDKDVRLRHAAIARGLPTVLHIATGANHRDFVKELLEMLDHSQVALKDMKGNTAFCFAAASGNLDIARLLQARNPFLPIMRGGNGCTPIQLAALQGKCEMTWFLYDLLTEDGYEFEVTDRELLFFTCIKTGNYHLALKMARKWEELAYARDENDDTALHLLALIYKPLDSCCHCPVDQDPIMINPGTNHVVFQMVNFLWTTILRKIDSKSEIITIISEPSQVLFDAAQVGNFWFLSELVNAYPTLIWEVDNRNRSIIHTAVSQRHADIFNLIHEIGPTKEIIVKYFVEEGNTLLHLAAQMAPISQLELVSGGPALQMSHELIWFEEVKKRMPPSYIKLKNYEGLTAEELFTREHEGLRKKGEAWMKRTAEFCMLISTVIATAVFSAAINIPGGIDDQTEKPNYLGQTSFQVFAISDAIALISSATAILIFLSILISRYAEYDFYKSLPWKLILGMITLFISITSMMVAFGSAFFIMYKKGLSRIPILISVLACLPILVFLALQSPLWLDIIYSTYYCRNIFKPSKRMIYLKEEKRRCFDWLKL